MRILLPTLLLFATLTQAQPARKGTLETKTFEATSLKKNITGEETNRRISVYLPPGYATSKSRYPVIYFLHGFAIDDANILEYMGLQDLMDKAISSRLISPVILVVPNSDTRFKGSFYTNSESTGNWIDYIASDVVKFVDAHFRTIPEKNARGISGHSMGGNGTLKIAMSAPETFGAVYAMSPAILNWAEDFTLQNAGFKKVISAKTEAELFKGFGDREEKDPTPFYTVLFANLARTYSPDPSQKLLFGNVPLRKSGDTVAIDPAVLKNWEANFPYNMIDSHTEALKKYLAIKIDWGWNDDFPHIPASCRDFSRKLEEKGIKHFAEAYNGDHVNKLDGTSGRFFTELLPFFNNYLTKAYQPVK